MTYRFRNGKTEQVAQRFADIDAAIAAEDARQRQRAAERPPMPRSSARERIEAHAAAMRERNAWVLALRQRTRRQWAEKKALW